MSNEHPSPDWAPLSFASLSDLRAAHIRLMREARRDGHDDDHAEPIRAFVERVKATGQKLDSPADRDAAQNILTYWASHLFSAGDRMSLEAALPVLDRFDPKNAPDLSAAPCPFEGLSAFTEDDASRFLGREEAVKTVLDKLRDEPALVIVGPMGAGKTSLVFAGVVPALRARLDDEGREPLILSLFPGTDPFAALLEKIHDNAAGLASMPTGQWILSGKKELLHSPERLATMLETLFPGQPAIIVVDHLEDLLTLCQTQEEREKFASALTSASRDTTKGNRVILILDERYRKQALCLPAFEPLAEKEGARYSLPPLAPADTLRIVESAAARVGLKFDDGVVEDLASDMAGDVSGLPALQFALGRLWEERDGDRIGWDAYRRVGRPREALRRTAEAIYGNLSNEEKIAARMLFMQLARPTAADGAGHGFFRRRIRRDVLAQLEPQHCVAHVLERYSEAGLIRNVAGDGWNDDSFEITHEALIDNWPRLREWLQNEGDAQAKKLQLIAMARRWRESGSKKGYLLSGGALEDAEGYAEAAPELKDFVAAGKKRQRASTALKWGASIVGISAIAILYGLITQLKANIEKRQAEQIQENTLNAVNDATKVIFDRTQSGTIGAKLTTELLSTHLRLFEKIGAAPRLNSLRANLSNRFSDIFLWAGDRTNANDFAKSAESLAISGLALSPDDDDWLRLRYESAFRVGDLEAKDHNIEAARQDYLLALQIAQRLAEKNSSQVTNVAFIENKIGDIFSTTRQWEAALEAYRVSLSIGDRLALTDPSNPEAQKTIADARTRAGDLFSAQNLPKDAYPEYEAALSVQKRLVAASQENAIYKSNLARTHHQLGKAYAKDGRSEDAMRQYDEARTIREGLAKDEPDKLEWVKGLVSDYVEIGDILAMRSGKRNEALENYRLGQEWIDKFLLTHKTSELASLRTKIVGKIESVGQHEGKSVRSRQDRPSTRQP